MEILICNTGDLSGLERMKTVELADFLKSCATPDVMLLQEISGEFEAERLSYKDAGGAGSRDYTEEPRGSLSGLGAVCFVRGF